MTDIDALLREFADAQIHANDGMTGEWPTVLDARGIPCTPHMARHNNAVYVVFDLAGTPGLPAQIQGYVAACNDAACPGCVVSSSRTNNHPECNAKIDRYFAAREALIELARSKLPEKEIP